MASFMRRLTNLRNSGGSTASMFFTASRSNRLQFLKIISYEYNSLIKNAKNLLETCLLLRNLPHIIHNYIHWSSIIEFLLKLNTLPSHFDANEDT